MNMRLAILGLAAIYAAMSIGTVSSHAAQFSQAPGQTPGQESHSRTHVTIYGDMVRLGDLFTNTGEKASLPIDRAPQLGSRTIYDVHRLAALARGHGLYWKAKSWSENVTVERPGQTFDREELLAVVRGALEERDIKGKWEMDVRKKNLSLTVPLDRAGALSLKQLRYNERTKHFVAVIEVSQDAKSGRVSTLPPARLSVSGRIYQIIDVPMLSRRLSRNDVIQSNDITWTTMRADNVNRNIIIDKRQLIGMTPRQTILPGKPVLHGLVIPPKIVKKGSIVTMVLQMPNMMLTAKGRAMEAGAKGEVIRIKNLQSKTIIEAEIVAPGTVHVAASPLAPTTASLTRR